MEERKKKYFNRFTTADEDIDCNDDKFQRKFLSLSLAQLNSTQIENNENKSEDT